MIAHKTHYLENNKQIDVFDGVFPLDWRLNAYNFCRDSYFKIGWSDGEVPERKSHDYFLHSQFNQQDIDTLGILQYFNNTKINKLFDGLAISKSILNLSVPSDVHYTHTHQEKKIALYYVNLEWRDGWHGETHFYSEDLTSIQFSTPYTPGRLIIFDANIPHTIRPQSTVAPHHRFTLTVIYDNLNKVIANRIAL